MMLSKRDDDKRYVIVKKGGKGWNRNAANKEEQEDQDIAARKDWKSMSPAERSTATERIEAEEAKRVKRMAEIARNPKPKPKYGPQKDTPPMKPRMTDKLTRVMSQDEKKKWDEGQERLNAETKRINQKATEAAKEREQETQETKKDPPKKPEPYEARADGGRGHQLTEEGREGVAQWQEDADKRTGEASARAEARGKPAKPMSDEERAQGREDKYNKLDDERGQRMAEKMNEMFGAFMEEGHSNKESLEFVADSIGDAFLSVTNMEDHDDGFMDNYEDNPIITPVMAFFFKLASEKFLSEDEAMDIQRFTEPTVDNESIPFHLGMIDKYKTPRPDKAVKVLEDEGAKASTRWWSPDGGGHNALGLLTTALATAVDDGHYDLDAAIREMQERKDKRGEIDAQRGEERRELNRDFDVDYTDDDEETARAKLDEQYKNILPRVSSDSKFVDSMVTSPLGPKSRGWVKNMLAAIQEQIIDAPDEMETSSAEESFRGIGPLQPGIENVNQYEKDKLISGDKANADDSNSEHIQRSLAFSAIQDEINEHARITLNAPSIGTAGAGLEGWGRQSSTKGSPPIMTPALRALGDALGVGITDGAGKNVPDNAPDIMALIPTMGRLGAEQVQAGDPQYKNQIINAVIADDNDSLFHPSIREDGEISEAYQQAFGDDESQRVGLLPGAMHTIDDEKPGMESVRNFGMGTSATDFADNAVTDIKGLTKYISPQSDEWKGMTEKQKKKYFKQYGSAFRANKKKWLQTGKYATSEGVGAKSAETMKRLESAATHARLRYMQTQLDNNNISQDQYMTELGEALSGEDGDAYRDYLIEQEQKQDSLDEVPEGHYLYADKDGNKLDEAGRIDKLHHAYDTMLGVAGILRAAKGKLGDAEEDDAIANEGDLAILFKPPSTTTAEEKEKLSSFHAAGITKDWWSNQIAKNHHIQSSISESGFTAEDYINMAARVMGSSAGKSTKETMSDAMVALVRQMGLGGKYAGATAQRILSYLEKNKEQEMDNSLHHEKTIKQADNVKNGTMEEGAHDCVGCVESPERTGNPNLDTATGGGKYGRVSPYGYKLKESPDISNVRMGVLGEQGSDYDQRGKKNLISIYWDLMGLDDDEDGWSMAENIMMAKGEQTARFMITQKLNERTKDVGENFARKYNLGMTMSQSEPVGIAADIENDVGLQTFYSHFYPGASFGDEKREMHERGQKQRGDIQDAVHLYWKLTAKKIKMPKMFEGKVSRRNQAAFITNIIKASGGREVAAAQRKLDKFQNGYIMNEGKATQRKKWGYEELKSKFDAYRIPEYEENLETINKISEISQEKRTPEQKSERASLSKRNANLRDVAATKLKNAKVNTLQGDDDWLTSALGVKKKEKASFAGIRGAYKRTQNAYRNLTGGVKVAQANQKSDGFSMGNESSATLASLLGPIQNIAHAKVSPQQRQDMIDELHKEVYIDDRGLNTRKRFKFNMNHGGGVRSVSEDYQNTLEEGISGGLRGDSNTAGSDIDYNMAVYHIPKPNSSEKALALLKENGVQITPQLKTRMREAYERNRAPNESLADMIEGDARDHGIENNHFTEQELIRKNQSYTDVNRKNFANKTGGPSRCGTCAGSAKVSLGEFATYARAHHDNLKGAKLSSREMISFISKHGRPKGYQTFDEYNDSNLGADVEHMNHNILACPDCEHWDATCGPSGGMVSDGICGGCLGNGVVDKDDDVLKEQLEQHRHKTPSSMNIQPEDLRDMMSMKAARQIKTGGYDADTRLDELMTTNETKNRPVLQRDEDGNPIKNESGSGFEWQMEDNSNFSLNYFMDMIGEGKVPHIATPEQLQSAREEMDKLHDSINGKWISSHENDTTPEHEEAKRKARPEQTQTEQTQLPGMTQSQTLDELLEKGGKESLQEHLGKMIARAEYLEGKEHLTDEGLEDEEDSVDDEEAPDEVFKHDDTDSSLVSRLKKLANKAIGSDYLSAFCQDQHGNKKNARDAPGHLHLDEMQQLIQNQLQNKWHAQHKELLATNAIEGYAENENESEKKKQRKSLYSSPYTRPRHFDPPTLIHYKGRMVTPQEYDILEDHHHKRDATTQKTPQKVREFFTHNKNDKSLIARAFKRVGSNWKRTKKAEEGEMTQFLKDVDGLIDKGESPINNVVNSELPANDDFLELKGELGLLTDDDTISHPLTDGKTLHPSLEHHIDNARKWLTGYKQVDGVWTPKKNMFTTVQDDIKNKARGEWVATAIMRATKEFFRQNCKPPSGKQNDQDLYDSYQNDDGQPMSLEDYIKNERSIGDDKENKNLQDTIKSLICDAKGDPILDKEENFDDKSLTVYHINKGNLSTPIEEGGMFDRGLQTEKYSFKDYHAARIKDAKMNYEPVSPRGLGTEFHPPEGVPQDDNDWENRTRDDREPQAETLGSFLGLMKHYHAVQDEIADDDGLSNEQAKKIVGAANKFYDLHFYPNLYMEQALQTVAHENGVDIEDLPALFEEHPELTAPLKEIQSNILEMHPSWCSYNISAMKGYDLADKLQRDLKHSDDLQNAFTEDWRNPTQQTLGGDSLSEKDTDAAQSKQAAFNAVNGITPMTNVVDREPLGVDDYAPPQETAPQDIDPSTGKPYPATKDGYEAVKPFYPPKEDELQFPNQLRQPTAEEQQAQQAPSVQQPTMQEQLSQWAKQQGQRQ